MSGNDSSWSFAAGLFVGALTGAALATLFTPRSGAQNRETVRDRGLVLKARVNEATTSARESANATATTLKSTANTAVDRVQSTAQTVRSRVSDVTERVRDVTERVSDRVSSITQRGQDTSDTTVDTSETPVRRTAAKVYTSAAPASTADDLADRVEAQTDGTDRATEVTEQAVGRAEQAIDTTVGAPGARTDATLPDNAAVINGANTLPSTTGIQIDTTYTTPSASGTPAGQTEPLTQPLNVDAGATDAAATATSSSEDAVNENNDNVQQLGRNQVGNRYRR